MRSRIHVGVGTENSSNKEGTTINLLYICMEVTNCVSGVLVEIERDSTRHSIVTQVLLY